MSSFKLFENICKKVCGKHKEIEEVKVTEADPYPTEFLLPKIEKTIDLAEFPFIVERKENTAWTEEKLKEEIIRVGHWEYYFPFSYGLTTRVHSSFNDDTINFHRYRSKLISETVIELLKEDASKSTVVDLACHCGCFSMDLAQRGVKHVQGIEYREKNLAQANFLKDYYKMDNVSFAQGDVYELDRSKKYDVVMCLGILYHVVRPIDLVEYCYQNSNKFAVIETICSKQPVSAYMVIGGKNPNVAIEGTRSVEFQPTYRGLIDTMKEVGFKNIVEVVGKCDTHIDLFSEGYRRCLIGFK